MEPRVANKYRLGRKIGSGSFGEIYIGIIVYIVLYYVKSVFYRFFIVCIEPRNVACFMIMIFLLCFRHKCTNQRRSWNQTGKLSFSRSAMNGHACTQNNTHCMKSARLCEEILD